MTVLGIRRPPEWGVDPTPENVRILRTFDLFVFWASLAVGLLVFAAGGILVLFVGLTLWEVVAVSLIGSVIGAMVLAGAGVYGSKFGIPTMVSLRPILGSKGSWIPSVLNIFQLVGWTSFELYIMGFVATTLSGSFLGGATVFFWIAVFAVIVVTLAIGGPLVVIRTWLEKVAIWLVLASTIIIAYQIFTKPIDWQTSFIPKGSGSLLLGIDLVIAMPISWWPLISDYNRFSRSRKDAARGTIFGYTLANFVFYFLGAAVIFATRATDSIVAIGALGFGSFVLLLILVDETDNAFADVYSTAISFQSIRKKTKQFGVIVLATGVALMAAVYLSSVKEPIGGNYENFLLFIGALFVPLLGIVLADFWLVRRGHYRIVEFYGGAPDVKWRAFAAWVPGIVLYYLLSPSLVQIFWPEFNGLQYSIGASIPSFLLSALIYFALSKIPLCAKDENPSGVMARTTKADTDTEPGSRAQASTRD